MKILVCGGRDYYDENKIMEVLTDVIGLEKNVLVIHGACKTGTDSIVQKFCDSYLVTTKPYPANWEKFGRRAGPIRNQQMLDDNPDIDVFIAFPGGAGTKDMVKKAMQSKIPRINICEW